MRSCRSWRRVGSAVLAGAVLFTQLVTTAHACAMANAAGVAARAADRAAAPSAAAGMPCAERNAAAGAPAAALDGVCQQHCQFGTTQQPAEPMQLLPVVAALPALLWVLAVEPCLGRVAPGWRAHERVRERAPPPDLRVTHCCYRL